MGTGHSRTATLPDMNGVLPDEIEELRRTAVAAAASCVAGTNGPPAEPVRAAFGALGTGELLTDEDAVARLAAVVVLEVFGGAAAGAMLVVDQPGMALGALAAIPDADLVGRLRAAAARGEVVGLAVVDEPVDVVAWVPGASVPAGLVQLAPDGITVTERPALAAVPAPAGAAEASGGVEVRVIGPSHRFAVDTFPARSLARLWVAAIAVGVGAAALDHAIAYGRERVVFGRPVLAHQANAHDVAAVWARLDAARVAVRSADTPWAMTQAYLEALPAALDAADWGVQLLGGHGYVDDHPAQRWYREAHLLRLLVGGADAAIDDLADRVLDEITASTDELAGWELGA